MIIAIDFDGTCVTHAFPYIGHDIGAESVLRRLVNQEKHQLILWTMRSCNLTEASAGSKFINTLDDAVKWFRRKDIPLHGVNCNPHQASWSSSPKVYAQLYIDDAALGIPLKSDANLSDRPFVDWVKTEQLLVKMKLLTPEQ